MVFATGLQGGVWQDLEPRCDKATFVYMPHSAVVIPGESALALRTREKDGDESDPPKKGGACDPG